MRLFLLVSSRHRCIQHIGSFQVLVSLQAFCLIQTHKSSVLDFSLTQLKVIEMRRHYFWHLFPCAKIIMTFNWPNNLSHRANMLPCVNFMCRSKCYCSSYIKRPKINMVTKRQSRFANLWISMIAWQYVCNICPIVY